NKTRILKKYILFDLLASILVLVLFMIFRKTVNNISIFEGSHFFVPSYNYIASFFLFPIACVIVHGFSGFYLNPIKQSRVSLILNTFVASLFISMTVFSVLMLNDVVVSYEYYYYSLLVLFVLLFGVTYFFRSIIFSQIRHNFKTKKWTTNTIIIGTGEKALKIASELEQNATHNTLIGYISTDNIVNVPKNMVLGSINKLDVVFGNHYIEESIIAIDNADEHQLFTIINLLYKYNIDIQFTPRLYEILTGSAKISKMGIIPLVNITNPSISDFEASLKRIFDIVVSIISIILLSPMLIHFMMKIKKDSKGPVFYRQERIGRLGKPFKILKFRTMYMNSENGTPQLSSLEDERITNVGKVMRKYRIDEIPQFWNILKGDMSLVGPRPERRFYINQIIEEAPYYCLLYKIRPGLTSWGPIKIGYSDTIEKMIERLNYDIIYLDNMSFLTDLKILIYTFEIIFKGKGM
ncbi:MAG: sugar transferase, partial [Paludibacter sp.]